LKEFSELYKSSSVDELISYFILTETEFGVLFCGSELRDVNYHFYFF